MANARTWIADTQGDPLEDGPTFLLSVSRDGSHYGWQYGKLSAVLDMITDRAWADYVGEEADSVDVFVLTEVCPVPVSVTSKRHPGIGMIEHTVLWRDPLVKGRGKAGQRSMSGYTRMLDA